MKVMINKCNHGFTLSEAQKTLFPDTPLELIPRHDEKLIASFELGDRRGDGGSTLKVVEIPEGSHYMIRAYDGVEDIYYSASPIEAL
jgi:hypothetical protein